MSEGMMNKCYECKYRGEIPGDAHSSCNHPATKKDVPNRIAGLLAVFGRLGAALPELSQKAADELHIKANYHGVRNGWFNWPYNFDPTWLVNCDGFTPREGRTNANGDSKS